MTESECAPAIVIGAGPAGLSAAYELAQRGCAPLVIEAMPVVGGLARTEAYRGFRFDIGGHRFFTKSPEVGKLWQSIIGGEFRRVSRISRIYHHGRFFNYPLEMLDTLVKLGPLESVLCVADYLGSRLRPRRDESTFEGWVINRFGRRLFEAFFQGYTEKVWGVPCSQIAAEWAAQRIRGMSLRAVIIDALSGRSDARTLIHEFHYPTLGSGMMWERMTNVIEEQGGRLRLSAKVLRVVREGNRVVAVDVQQGATVRRIAGARFVSSMPLDELIQVLDPLPPDVVLETARGLRYRDFILVGLILNQPALFPDQWIYIQSPDVQVGRVQNFGNWSPAMLPDSAMSGLGMEYFCTEGDALWRLPDADLIKFAARELAHLGLARAASVIDGIVIRQLKAYPLYDQSRQERLAVLRSYLAMLDNLQTVGRSGMHHYNNMDHAMLTGLLGARNLLGEQHDIWHINDDEDYLEAPTRRSKTQSIAR